MVAARHCADAIESVFELAPDGVNPAAKGANPFAADIAVSYLHHESPSGAAVKLLQSVLAVRWDAGCLVNRGSKTKFSRKLMKQDIVRDRLFPRPIVTALLFRVDMSLRSPRSPHVSFDSKHRVRAT